MLDIHTKPGSEIAKLIVVKLKWYKFPLFQVGGWELVPLSSTSGSIPDSHGNAFKGLLTVDLRLHFTV